MCKEVPRLILLLAKKCIGSKRGSNTQEEATTLLKSPPRFVGGNGVVRPLREYPARILNICQFLIFLIPSNFTLLFWGYQDRVLFSIASSFRILIMVRWGLVMEMGYCKNYGPVSRRASGFSLFVTMGVISRTPEHQAGVWFPQGRICLGPAFCLPASFLLLLAFSIITSQPMATWVGSRRGRFDFYGPGYVMTRT